MIVVQISKAFGAVVKVYDAEGNLVPDFKVEVIE